MAGTKEKDFENAIERDLVTSGGYTALPPQGFDPERGLFAEVLLDFVRASQPDTWATLAADHGNALGTQLVEDLCKTRDRVGLLEVLRRGFKVFGTRVHTAFFRPASGLNVESQRRYAANRLTVSRQVRPSATANDSVDVVLALNGLPVATLELKNAMTGQTTAHAKKQYRDRDPRLTLFRFDRGALVHFAVDTDTVAMATRLAKGSTRFLPFDRGADGGAGNPTILGEDYPTAYLWQQILVRDSLLDVVQRFVHLEKPEDPEPGRKRGPEVLIFPRYHQLDAVRKLEAAAIEEGPGHSYLIQHSAGSGKSNSIAWLAHRLSKLHVPSGGDEERLFHSVVVVTDRRVLDKQLQDTIFQFDHQQGVVERIDKNSKQLAAALTNGTPIVITTLQKFPFVAEHLGTLPQRRYAVIVDEAHSSQSGEAARSLKEVLGDGMPEGASVATRRAIDRMVAEGGPLNYDAEADPSSGADPSSADPSGADPDDGPSPEDVINRVMASRGRQRNLSFFAFTATPKGKTLQLFGRPGPDGSPVPFHLYSMRQAIEEGFILDVLENYTTYATYFELVSKAAEDPDVDKREAAAALSRFVSLHPVNVDQKTKVIVDHFLAVVRHLLGGRARAMVVTRSRLHAVRYKRAFDRYLADLGERGTGVRALVAFSGEVTDPDTHESATEVQLNAGMSEAALPGEFAKDPNRVLIVAEKYQTGFDQPLLCAMYVDKKLAGVQAVQTLSRLNRSCGAPGEKKTFVLDFVNEAAEIQEAFQPFYECTLLEQEADPAQLDQLAHELDAEQVWWKSELEGFAKVFYRPKQRLTDREHAEVERWLRPAVDRFKGLADDEARDAWRSKLASFCRLYEFLSQVMRYTDRELEVRASFGKLLLRKLPGRSGERFRLDGEVDLDAYRLSKVSEGRIELEKGSDAGVSAPTAVGTRKADDEEAPLSEIIRTLNERFGTEFTEADRLFFDQVVEDAVADESVRERAQANTFENFALSMQTGTRDMMIDRMQKNDDVVVRYLDDQSFRETVFAYLATEMFKRARGA